MINIQEGISSIKRIKTGVPGLDTVIQGGLPKNSITLVSGPPGSGKSILCFQFLWDGVKNNEKCLYLTLDKKAEGLIIQAKELGLNFEPAMGQGLIKFEYLNINKKQIYEKMTNEILSKNYDRIVLDSITPLSEMPIFMRNLEDFDIDTNSLIPDDFPDGTTLPTRRLHLRYIMSALESSNCTSIVTSELPVGSNMLSRDGISEFLADGVITLNFDPTMDRRKLAVMKMRNTKHTLKPQSMQIDTGGIKLV